MEPVQVDRRKNIREFGDGDVKLRQQFDLAAGNGRIDAQISRDGNKVLLQYLQRYNSSPRAPVFGHQVERFPLLGRRSLVIGVDEDVGVEKATSGHRLGGLYLVDRESRRD